MILGVGLMAACGGSGGEDGSAEPSPTTGEPTTTTATEHRIDVYQPIPGGSLHGTPRPPLENTGDDYVAITESLIANFRWLTENPDPAIVSELFVPGTSDHDGHVQTFASLMERSWRAADDGYVVRSIEHTGDADVVTLRVVDFYGTERVLDASGVQVGATAPHVEDSSWRVVLANDDARWRIADWSLEAQPVAEL